MANRSLFRFTFNVPITTAAIDHMRNCHMTIEKIGGNYVLARGTDDDSYQAGKAEGVSLIQIEAMERPRIAVASSPPDGYVIYDGKC